MPFEFGRKDDVRRYVKGAYHTKISDKNQLAEIEKIADRLEADEEVLLVAKQTKNVLKKGVRYLLQIILLLQIEKSSYEIHQH